MRAYHVTDTGEAVEIEMRDSLLEGLDAVLVLDDQRGDLWVLRGQLDVKKKFLVARTAANLNLAEGLKFRIRHVEPDERQNIIQSLIVGEQPQLASIAEFEEIDEGVSVSSIPPAPESILSSVEPKPTKVSSVSADSGPSSEPESISFSMEAMSEPLPKDVSTFFENFTRLAIFEHMVPKEDLPPRTELEKRLQTYLKTFMDALYD
jgi:hypothetical protein